MGINQFLMGLTGLIFWFKVQQKTGAKLMPEQGFQIIILNLKPCSGFSVNIVPSIAGLLIGVIDLYKVEIVFQGYQ